MTMYTVTGAADKDVTDGKYTAEELFSVYVLVFGHTFTTVGYQDNFAKLMVEALQSGKPIKQEVVPDSVFT